MHPGIRSSVWQVDMLKMTSTYMSALEGGDYQLGTDSTRHYINVSLCAFKLASLIKQLLHQRVMNPK